MKKRLIFFLKVAVMLAVVGVMAWKFYAAWQEVGAKHITIDWRWGGLAAACIAGSMLTSGIVWRWLAARMGDRSPVVPLVAAYTFSQLGKYVFGKVALLLMRIDRAGRYGMSPQVCTLSTLLENALYMVSGGLVGMTAIVRIVGGLEAKYRPFIPFLWPAMIVVIVVLLAAVYPPVFYSLVNRLLRSMKKPEVPQQQRLPLSTLILAVVGFVPCWLFGGLSLWCTSQSVHEVPLLDCWWFGGAFALSVIIGMASFLPGGLGIREAVIAAAATIQFAQFMPNHADAIIAGGMVAALQRVFQLVAEVALGVMGGAVTSVRKSATGTLPAEKQST